VLGKVEDLLGELLDSLRHTYFSHERLSMLTGLQHSLGGPPGVTAGGPAGPPGPVPSVTGPRP
jgi:hypothetical protein